MIIVYVVVTNISIGIIVKVCLILICIAHTTVTSLSATIPICVSLVPIGHKSTAVMVRVDAVIVRVVVTGVPHTIPVSVLLTRVGVAHTVVLGAGGLRAWKIYVRPAIIVIVRPAMGARPNISMVTPTLITWFRTKGWYPGTAMIWVVTVTVPTGPDSIRIAHEGRTFCCSC